LPTEKFIVEKTRCIVEPICEEEGFELVHVEFQKEACGKVLRIYINKQGGITLNDCSVISRQVSDFLDVNFEINNKTYSLEVSSPGSNRPLGKKSDFEKFKGNEIIIKFSQPIENNKKIKGVLLGIAEGIVTVMDRNNNIISIPFNSITRARLANYYGENRCLQQT